MGARKGRSLALVEDTPRRAPASKGKSKQAKRGRPVGATSHPLVLPESAERVLVTVNEAARRLSVSRYVCYRLIRSGELESITVGRLRRVPVAALERFVARAASA